MVQFRSAIFAENSAIFFVTVGERDFSRSVDFRVPYFLTGVLLSFFRLSWIFTLW